MRFRTKLFLTWSSVVLLLCAGMLWPVQRAIQSSMNHIVNVNFAGTRQGLHSMQMEQIDRMRQTGAILMDIPELRALIAEQNYEVSKENLDSLRERLDSLADVVDVKFVCVLDGRPGLVAQNSKSPWKSLRELGDYLSSSAQAGPLVADLFRPSQETGAQKRIRYGLWLYRGNLYQVVGLPLRFGQEDSASPDGALLMGEPVTDAWAASLGTSHGCKVSFIVDGQAIATGFDDPTESQVEADFAKKTWPISTPFDLRLGNVDYRSYLEPLVDPISKSAVGNMLIQTSMADGQAARRKVFESLLAIMSAGLLAAAVVSFMVSGAITRPVQQLLAGVQRIAGGDLESSMQIHMKRRDELGELAAAFDDMIVQLRRQRELQRLVEQTQAASKAKGQFLANMSHEIRTPLHGVIGITGLLLRTGLDENQRRYAELIRSSTEVLTTLINDILDFSKIEAGKLDLENIVFDPRKVTGDVVELLLQKAAEKPVRMKCHVAADVPAAVRGDPNRLRQILINLIGNSIKFTSKGRIVVALSRASDLLRFEIRDTGIGIAFDRMDRLFKSFSQVDASTTRRYGGTGLGLAICKQLSELMGGTIGVESEVDKGSTFWFTANLPAVDATELQQSSAEDDEPEAKPNVGQRQQRQLQILLAEDNEVNQIVAAEILADAGYRCQIVGDGRAAVKAVMEQDFDLVLMDCQMPEMDGFEATQAIRQQEQNAAGSGRRIPIIALTANASGADRDRCLAAGMDEYCGKPFQPKQLLRLIEGLLTEAIPAAAAAVAPPLPAGAPWPMDVDALLQRCSGKESVALAVLDKFATQSIDVLRQIEQSLKDQNAAELARLSHSLKGTAGILAAEPLRLAAAGLEEIARKKNLEFADESMAELREQIAQCAGVCGSGSHAIAQGSFKCAC